MKEHTKKRGSFKAKLTFFSKYLSDIQKKEEISELDIIQLRDRLERIQQVFIEFEETQNIIECSAQDVENEYRERQSFEESFYSLTSSAKLIILEFENKHKNVEIASSNSDRTQGSAVLSQVSNNHIKLPTIHLPNFNGEYSNWLEFRDTYESLIHTNDGINAIQKFHYLRAVLEGGAAQVIRSLEFTSKNYTVAWQALLDRYNNNRLLVQNHVKALFNMEILQKESADGLRKIIDSISKNLHALEQLKQPTENWDTLIVYLVTTKLDNLKGMGKM